MRPGDRLEAQRGQALAELPRARAQVGQPLAALGAVGDVDGRHGRRAVGRAERVRVDVGVGLLPHGLDQLGAAGDEAAVDAEGLAEGADQDVHARAAVLLGAAPGRAVGPDAVRVVHHRHDAVAEAVLVGGASRAAGRRSGASSPRMLKMPSKMTTTRPMPSGTASSLRARSSTSLCAKIGAAVVRHVGDAHRADDAVVVQLVADPERVRARQRDRRAEDRGVGRVERLGRRAPDERGDALLERHVVQPTCRR